MADAVPAPETPTRQADPPDRKRRLAMVVVGLGFAAAILSQAAAVLWIGEVVLRWSHWVPLLILPAWCVLRRSRLWGFLAVLALAGCLWPWIPIVWGPRTATPEVLRSRLGTRPIRVATADLSSWTGRMPELVEDLGRVTADVLVLVLPEDDRGLTPALRDLGSVWTDALAKAGTWERRRLAVVSRLPIETGGPDRTRFITDGPWIVADIRITAAPGALRILAVQAPGWTMPGQLRQESQVRPLVAARLDGRESVVVCLPDGWPATSPRSRAWLGLGLSWPSGSPQRLGPAWLPTAFRPPRFPVLVHQAAAGGQESHPLRGNPEPAVAVPVWPLLETGKPGGRLGP